MAIEFSSKSLKYSEFSNFYAAPFVIDGQTWQTVEHYFQAAKFLGDPLQELIRTAKTPQQAKKLGRTRSPAFRADWETVKESVMEIALKAKFTQNQPLADLLKSTGNTELREKAFWDSYWGTGRNGRGRNRMGHLLQDLRDNL
jgi:ribA/ribD-fused uncharacterized protein